MSAVRWSELPPHLVSRIAPDSIPPQKPRNAPAAPPVPAPAPVDELPETPTAKKWRRDEESRMSMRLADWRNKCIELKIHPEVRWFHAIPNGSNRGKRAAGIAKAEGQLSGVLDWFLPVARGPWPGMMIELKLPQYRTRARGGLKVLQQEYADFVVAQGYKQVTCYSDVEAREAVEAYLALPKVSDL